MDDPCSAAWDSADFAYRAVFQTFSNEPEVLGHEGMAKSEQNTAQCIEELKFQLAYLAEVEESGPVPSTYSILVSRIK
jgi:hypothetical protein